RRNRQNQSGARSEREIPLGLSNQQSAVSIQPNQYRCYAEIPAARRDFCVWGWVRGFGFQLPNYQLTHLANLVRSCSPQPIRSAGTPPPPPYVDPIRPKVTQCHPMLRESAEGRNTSFRADCCVASFQRSPHRHTSTRRLMHYFTICSPLCQGQNLRPQSFSAIAFLIFGKRRRKRKLRPTRQTPRQRARKECLLRE